MVIKIVKEISLKTDTPEHLEFHLAPYSLIAYNTHCCNVVTHLTTVQVHLR